MKYAILIFIFFIGGNKSQAGELLTEVPIVIHIFPTCTLDDKCKLSITFENLSKYKIKMFSHSFKTNSVTYQGVIGLLGREYRKMNERKEFKELPKNIVYKEKSDKYLTKSNSIYLEPLQKKAFILNELEKVYNLNLGDSYIFGFYLSFVHFYIDGNYALTTSIGSNKYAFLSIPSESLKPKINGN